MINDQQPTLLGLQEACPDQVAFLDENLPDYKRIGVAARTARPRARMMAIYYRDADFELEKKRHLRLSETPDQVSMGWDAACKRTCTWVLLRKADGRRVELHEHHLDHMGPTARKGVDKAHRGQDSRVLRQGDTPLPDGRLQLARRRPHLRPPEGRYDRGPQRRPRATTAPRSTTGAAPTMPSSTTSSCAAPKPHLQGALRRETTVRPSRTTIPWWC